MSFFHSKKTSIKETPPKKTLREIHAALNSLHDYKIGRNNNLMRKHRDLEEERNDLLLIVINNIAAHLDDTDANYRFCRYEITQLLANNMQQTKNYVHWYMKGKTLSDVSLGKLHHLCADLMPEALVDALVMMRSRAIPKVTHLKQGVDPETKETIQVREVQMKPRDLTMLDACLQNADKKTIKIFDGDQRIQTLREEIKITHDFAKMNISQYPENLQELFLEAKTLHADFLCDNMDKSRYVAFKQQVIKTVCPSNEKTMGNLILFVTHMEKMFELMEYGRELAHIAQQNQQIAFPD